MSRRLACLVLLALLWAPNLLLAEELPRTEPAAVGLSAERLARIGARIDQSIADGELVGAVSLVARRGKVAHFEAHGQLDRDKGVAMPEDAIFRVASMSKPITSVAVMILVEEGRLLLDDPLAKHLPEFAEPEVLVVTEDGSQSRVPATLPITVRDLLRHTSGLTYGIFKPETAIGKIYAEADIWNVEHDLEEFAHRVATLPLAQEPGTRFDYGVSVDILGALVQKVSGQRFEDFLRERLFGPLDMVDTGFHVPAEKADRLMTHYVATEDGLVAAPTFRDFGVPPAAPYGGAGIASTVRDYARFLQMLSGGGRLGDVRILSRKTVELMTTDHLHGLPGVLPGTGFGLGFAVRMTAGLTTPGSVGTYSWGGIYNTYFWVDPEEELFALLMTQVTPFNHRRLSERYRVMVYQAIDD